VNEELTSIQDAIRSQGIVTKHERMPNGELRFRLIAGDGSAYIRTVSGPDGAWQSSHFHRGVFETYIVQQGWIALVELINGDRLDWHVMRPGDVYTTRRLIAHNVYMSGGAALHTVKHGLGPADDWHASVKLDSLTNHLSEEKILTFSA
jgi:hypothetical protein